MAAITNCRFNPTLGGTTDWIYSSAVLGYQSPALANAIDGALYWQFALSADSTQWEISRGIYTSSTTTFSRSTVWWNSSGTGTAAGQSGAGTKISFTNPPSVAIVAVDQDLRERLQGARTYFVLTTGSDSNSGLANTAGGAFLTIQKAINVALTIDLNGFAVTIQVGVGTYAAGFLLSSPFIGGLVTVSGDTTTPSNVIITSAGALNVFEASGFGIVVSVQGFKISCGGSSGIGVYAHDGAAVTVGKMEFGAFPNGAHIQAARLAYVTISNGVAYTISGNANYHLNAAAAGRINTNLSSVTISGSLTFAGAFAQAIGGSWMGSVANTYTGTVTATRYNVTGNSVIDTSGSGASYFPGTVAGTTSTGGQYL